MATAAVRQQLCISSEKKLARLSELRARTGGGGANGSLGMQRGRRVRVDMLLLLQGRGVEQRRLEVAVGRDGFSSLHHSKGFERSRTGCRSASSSSTRRRMLQWHKRRNSNSRRGR